MKVPCLSGLEYSILCRHGSFGPIPIAYGPFGRDMVLSFSSHGLENNILFAGPRAQVMFAGSIEVSSKTTLHLRVD